jgi:hypothetical protein
MRVFAKAVISAICFLCAAFAHAEEWRIAQSSGDVLVRSGSAATPVALNARNSVVPPGATVVTGKAGRVVLVRADQIIAVGPSSVVTVPSENGQFSTILQRRGEARFEIDHQAIPHFAVETPFLAVTVKGTVFTVRVDQDDASVVVDRGLVQVTNVASGEFVDVAAGDGAVVGGKPGVSSLSGVHLDAQQGPERRPAVSPMSTEELAALWPVANDPPLQHQGDRLAAVGVPADDADRNDGDGGGVADDGRPRTAPAAGGGAILDASRAVVTVRLNSDYGIRSGEKGDSRVSATDFLLLVGFLSLVAAAVAYLKAMKR